MTPEENSGNPSNVINEEYKFCANCGTQVLKKAVICVKCGYSFPEYHGRPQNEEQSWSAFAFFLLIIGTLVIPFFGLVMGFVSLSTPQRRTQGVVLIVLDIIKFVFIALALLMIFGLIESGPYYYYY